MSRAEEFRKRIKQDTIISIRTDGNFDTSCLTDKKAVEEMNKRITENIRRNEIKIAKGKHRLDKEKCKIGDSEITK